MPRYTITRSTGGGTTTTTFGIPTQTSLTAPTTTPGRDNIRGDGSDEVIARDLTDAEQATFDYLVAQGLSDADAYDKVFLGEVQNAQAIADQLTSLGLAASIFSGAILDGSLARTFDTSTTFIFTGFTEASFFQTLASNPDFLPFLNSTFGTNFPAPTSVAQLLAIQNAFSNAFGPGPLSDPGEVVDNGDMGGNDTIYGRGGDDYIADLLGNNRVVTDDGDDRILLGEGNDRVYDSGGDNRIDILGGNNYIATRHGDDIINTGDGDDTINAFDGNNVIDAGDGDNRVRGGDDADIVRVGTGDDFVDVLTTGLLLNASGSPILDSNGDAIDQAVSVAIDGLVTLTDFGNIVIDQGGSDNIRATGNSRNDQPGFPDREFNGDDAVISDLGFFNTGDPSLLGVDRIEVGGGDNFIIDFGGDTRVRTLEGEDTVFTSFSVTGDDDINTGAGADTINPGAGVDIVRGGADGDTIELEDDGDADTLVYLEGDPTFDLANTDVVGGFDGFGVDKIDVSGLGLGFGNLLITALNPATVGDPNIPDVLIWWDADGDGNGDFFTTILEDFDSATLSLDSFVFDTVA